MKGKFLLYTLHYSDEADEEDEIFISAKIKNPPYFPYSILYQPITTIEE
jgi:hypothetical protein